MEPDDAGPGDTVESWMRIELARIDDDAVLTDLRNTLQRVLTDVREAVEDWPKMRRRALDLADELERRRCRCRTRTSPTRWRCCAGWPTTTSPSWATASTGWPTTASSSRRCSVPAWASCVRTRPGPRLLSSMSPEAYGRVMEKRLLIITKANSRSTVHRSAYLDYIGVKMFDAAGNVVGERRFLGLFSSAAYLTSVKELPVIKRKVAEVSPAPG